ncbi:MAG TPA: hypothetical protein PLZ14_14725, partial [Acidovorax temperans]|nr:hypothetical protein [Acidovorax temperans]
ERSIHNADVPGSSPGTTTKSKTLHGTPRRVFCFWPALLRRPPTHALRSNVRLNPFAGSEGCLLFQAFSASKPDVESASSYQ